MKLEKTDLMLQLEAFKKKQQMELDDVHKKLEDLLAQAVKLKEVNSRFVRR